MKTPIAILGAGPSGLLLGRLLEKANIDYVIYERDESKTPLTVQSGTLDIHAEDGQVALQEAGLMDRFKAIARYDAPTKIADTNGNVVLDLGDTSGDSDRPEIDRVNLRNLLLDSVPPGKIHWNSKVQHVQRDADGAMSVHFIDGTSQSPFQLVVGADGAWSKARSLITTAKPQYSDLCYLTTYIRPQNEHYSTAVSLAGKGNYNAIGSGKILVAQLLDDGSYYIVVGLRLPEHWNLSNALLSDPPALRRWLLTKHFAGWAKAHRDLIKHSEGDFRFWPLYASPLQSLSWQTVPGVTLIGDAAHVCPPSGDGVNVALTDSLQLSQQIVKHGLGSLDRAVAEYEKSMFPRAAELITSSAETSKHLFALDAPKGLLEMMEKMMGGADDAADC